ncbi:hypothetical protein K431DRAFT_196944, partial [Polychaeton citri CBS 116435]
LSNLINQGELIYQYAVRAVFHILPDTIVKINKSKGQTEIHTLHYIHKHSQQIPAPIPLGQITIGEWSYTFISFTQGVSLNHIFTELRQLPQEGYLGGGTPPVCIAGHRFSRTSSSPIVSEAQFKNFLLEDSWLPPARINYIHSTMSGGHRIVMTHGDLCPLNILVESDDRPRITGIVDWETAGAYPEYREYINALKISFDSEGDWCLYLPEAAIGRFFDEYAKYCAI